MGMWRDTAENAFVDWFFRAEAAPTLPADWYVGLFTSMPTDSAEGTEVSGNNYARAAITRGLAQWAGTQSAGSTDVSSGTSGTTSNNATLTFPVPSGNWGTIVGFGLFTASSGGTLWAYGAVTPNKVVYAGDPVYYSAGQLQLTWDS
jgi:hypothetical protein